ncbi:MAG: glycosyltransferase family 4 protein [Marinoscillum sp.]|uniref:glycosyltransferase family 4 protein n=1 Tax=Marinoscillum sp. TaxID=2024838 RepID=UPI0032FCE82A
MKIAIIINTSWNIYNFRRGLVRYFLDRGDEVITIAPEDAYSAKLEEIGCRFIHMPMSASGMNPVTDFVLLLKLRNLLKAERPDVVLTYTIKPNIYGSLAAGWLRIPCICNVSGLGTTFLWKGWVKKMATTLYSFAFRFNRWVFFQNADDRDEFGRFVKIDMSKTSLLPGSGVDIDYFKPGPAPEHSVPVFLMISRLLVEKGIYDFIEAIRIVKKKGRKARFRLIGGLDEEHSRTVSKRELEAWIGDGLITYQEHVEDVRSDIARADVVVLPSYREGTPRTLLEAGAMGKPLIATDVPGCNHVLIDGYNGFLCKVRNPKDLAAKMGLFLALSEEERLQMAQNARQSIVERFDERLVIARYGDKIDELVSGL